MELNADIDELLDRNDQLEEAWENLFHQDLGLSMDSDKEESSELENPALFVDDDEEKDNAKRSRNVDETEYVNEKNKRFIRR